LAVVLKRIDTGDLWVLTNSQRSRYWDDVPSPGNQPQRLGNKHLRLADMLCAATAMPFYFSPRSLSTVDNAALGVFIDASLSAYGNPALKLALVASSPSDGFGWMLGVDNFFLVSLGSAWSKERVATKAFTPSVMTAVQALGNSFADIERSTLEMIQWISKNSRDRSTDAQIGGAALFNFCRYEIEFHPESLRRLLGVAFASADVDKLKDRTSVAAMPKTYEIARLIAEQQVRENDFPSQFDMFRA
jgi:hypothetical protein